MNTLPDLIVFSHLRWNFVWQRPQHLLKRLAQHRRVLFIEEPLYSSTSNNGEWEYSEPCKNVFVCQPKTPLISPGFSEEQMPLLTSMMPRLLQHFSVEAPIAWFYTPMALPLLAEMSPCAIVYDCMDELSAFRNPPPQLIARETDLLAQADIVFTGGPSLYRAKKDRNPNVHCFPSSVDIEHFGRAQEAIEEPVDQAAIARPRLGYFGVIDERLDLNLVDHLAKSRPDWQIVLVGPVVKIDPETLPRRPNIHYLGQQEYARLPNYLAGWDVCLLPFALNEATRFISPTKTLEYMAAAKPIVSTAIADVVDLYREFVSIAHTETEFVALCENALDIDEANREALRLRMEGALATTSWDRTANAMNRLMEETAAANEGVANVATNTERPRANSRLRLLASNPSKSTTERPTERPIIVIGAGPTGLSAAYHLGEDTLLIEQNDTVGGLCRSMEVDGFTFDHAGHIMFSNDSYVHDMYKVLLGDNVHWQDREAWVYSKNVYTRYPFQGSLYGLPADVIKDCIVGAIESRFGLVKHRGGNGHVAHSNQTNAAPNLKAATATPKACEETEALSDCCADGILESSVPSGSSGNDSAKGNSNPDTKASENFEDFIYRVWGAGIAKHFAIPYNRKLWAVPLKEMETSWLGGRVPMPDLEEMIEGSLKPSVKPMGPNARFGYPLRGGFQSLMNGFLDHIQGNIVFNSKVSAISPSQHTLWLEDGSQYEYEQLISTMPLPVLVRLMGDEVPPEVQKAAADLKYVSVRCVNLGIGREKITDKHWIYYPEETLFHRLFIQGNASPHCNAPGGFGITCEITYHETHKPLPCDGPALIDRCIKDCRSVGMIQESDPIWTAFQVDLPHAYVVYDHARPKNVLTIRRWLETQDVILAGRYSEWEYYNSDHAFLAGKKAAEKVLSSPRAAWVPS